jgi:hypothetical protein
MVSMARFLKIIDIKGGQKLTGNRIISARNQPNARLEKTDRSGPVRRYKSMYKDARPPLPAAVVSRGIGRLL